MARAPVNVLLVDNHPLVLEGIRAVIETYDHIRVIGAAPSVSKALEIVRQTVPDVVLMDINMPEINGLDAIELFREQCPRARLLMLSMHDRREYISTAVMYGACGYVLKDVSTEEIIKAIETVAGGGTYFSTGVSSVLMREPPCDASGKPLTTREQAVLLLIAKGKRNQELADILDISVRTVETHRKNIKKKLKIDTTAGLTRYAFEHGLLQPTSMPEG